jgi:hypothetical protein
MYVTIAYVRRTTIFLPDDLHEELRAEAFRRQISIAEVIRLHIQVPTKAPVKAPRRAHGKRYAGSDPLLRVVGICGTTVMSANIDADLYT